MTDLFGVPAPTKKKAKHESAASGTDTWLTPKFVVDALGGADSFDLDPATPPSQPWATARARYTEADNGLLLPWYGRVFLNPPYSNPLIGRFMGRMVSHGRGTALIFARTETRIFFDCVWREATALRFLEGRLTFCDPTGRPGPTNAGAPSVLIAYGLEDAEILGDCALAGAFVPLRLPKAFVALALDLTWDAVIGEWLDAQGDAVRLEDLYRAFERHPKARRNPNYRAKIRQILQRGGYCRVDRGLWAGRERAA